MTDDRDLPPAVTFQSGADLLMELKIVDSITHQGIRYIADHHPQWPFGPGKEHQYWTVANATVMATGPFLDFFRAHPTASRGPDKQPRARGQARK
jgi:hypothetical protein